MDGEKAHIAATLFDPNKIAYFIPHARQVLFHTVMYCLTHYTSLVPGYKL